MSCRASSLALGVGGAFLGLSRSSRVVVNISTARVKALSSKIGVRVAGRRYIVFLVLVLTYIVYREFGV